MLCSKLSACIALTASLSSSLGSMFSCTHSCSQQTVRVGQCVCKKMKQDDDWAVVSDPIGLFVTLEAGLKEKEKRSVCVCVCVCV